MTSTTRPCVAIGLLALVSAGCSNDEALWDGGGTAGAAAGGGGTVGSGGANVGSGAAGRSSGGDTGLTGTGGLTAGGGGANAGSGGSAGSGAGSGGSAGSGGNASLPSTEKFSFFVTSMASMVELARERDPAMKVGFGGDFSYGETGPGAGLRGADKICAAVAEKGMPNNNKRWRAFLSVTAGEDGEPVHAIDRIGNGPWYDRVGRVFAMNLEGLRAQRPTGGDPTIADDFPNEFGVPNHQPDPTADEVDNHDTLTGSNAQGRVISMNKADTCNDWTSKSGNLGRPRVGHSWPRSNNDGREWISEHAAGGCAPGINIFGEGPPQPGDPTVGAGGGYGGIYCFALDP